MPVNGTSFKTAVKNFVKLHHSLKLNKIIITDQNKHMEATLKYYKNDGRNRVGINMYPTRKTVIASVNSPTIISPVVSPFVSAVVSPVIAVPALKVGNITTSSGPIVGNNVDLGPTLANIVKPIIPTVLATTSPIVTALGSTVAATAESLIIDNNEFLTSSPVALFTPRIITIN
jgi:hypothetical protein